MPQSLKNNTISGHSQAAYKRLQIENLSYTSNKKRIVLKP
jgi:hypothetical protein